MQLEVKGKVDPLTLQTTEPNLAFRELETIISLDDALVIFEELQSAVKLAISNNIDEEWEIRLNLSQSVYSIIKNPTQLAQVFSSEITVDTETMHILIHDFNNLFNKVYGYLTLGDLNDLTNTITIRRDDLNASEENLEPLINFIKNHQNNNPNLTVNDLTQTFTESERGKISIPSNVRFTKEEGDTIRTYILNALAVNATNIEITHSVQDSIRYYTISDNGDFDFESWKRYTNALDDSFYLGLNTFDDYKGNRGGGKMGAYYAGIRASEYRVIHPELTNEQLKNLFLKYDVSVDTDGNVAEKVKKSITIGFVLPDQKTKGV